MQKVKIRNTIKKANLYEKRLYTNLCNQQESQLKTLFGLMGDYVLLINNCVFDYSGQSYARLCAGRSAAR
jgi:RecB family endonuclease NucS